MTNRTRKRTTNTGRIESAVLVPLFYKNDKLHILFTKRSFNVMHHKGQISFPGGARSEADESLEDTALRESWEEIGLYPENVEIIGQLDDTLTSTSNFIISPYVGLIPYPCQLTINPNEIMEVFDMPLEDLLSKANFKEEVQENENGMETVYFYKYKGKLIWGATANILKQLLDELKSGSGAQD